jgi:hypothetical protein
MKAIIESTYYVRDKPISTYISFPVYSDKIEEKLSSHLEFLHKYGSKFTLNLRITNEHSGTSEATKQ